MCVRVSEFACNLLSIHLCQCFIYTICVNVCFNFKIVHERKNKRLCVHHCCAFICVCVCVCVCVYVCIVVCLCVCEYVCVRVCVCRIYSASVYEGVCKCIIICALAYLL